MLAAPCQERIALFTRPRARSGAEDVLSRENFAKRLAGVGSSLAQILAGYRALATIVRPAAIEPTVRADPDDDHVLACALGAQATLIVTLDRHLLDLGNFSHTRILPSPEALGLIPR